LQSIAVIKRLFSVQFTATENPEIKRLNNRFKLPLMAAKCAAKCLPVLSCLVVLSGCVDSQGGVVASSDATVVETSNASTATVIESAAVVPPTPVTPAAPTPVAPVPTATEEVSTGRSELAPAEQIAPVVEVPVTTPTVDVAPVVVEAEPAQTDPVQPVVVEAPVEVRPEAVLG